MELNELIAKSDFNSLPIFEKAKIALLKAICIGARDYKEYYIKLYLYNNYFFEVWSLSADKAIVKIEVLEEQKNLRLLY